MEHATIRFRSWAEGASAFLPLVIVALTILIFVLDTVTPLEIAVAVFYGVVVLMSAFSFEKRGILWLAAACMTLTVASHFLTPHGSPQSGLVNGIISLSAIAATTYLVLKIKAAEAATLEAQAQLAHMGRVATLGELTASIAHEVNQPLAAVVTNGNACSRWLNAQPPNLDEARQAVDRIVMDANRASQVVERVRGLATRGRENKEWLNLNEVVADVIALTRGEVQRNRIALRTQFAEDLPLILGDRVQLQQVVLNLMVNALEAIAEVDTGVRELSVTTGKDEAGSVHLAMIDSGNGPDAAHMNQLFDAFYTTKPGGMGMGLAISRSIIERHGGRIWAEANHDHGTVLQFTLPGLDAAS